MSTLTEVITYGPFTSSVPVATVALTATDASGNHIGIQVAAGATGGQLTLTPGVWTVTAQAQDASGNAIGPVATDPQTYTVTAPSVQIPVSLAGTNV
jgi:hypothetical protein